MEVTPIFWIVFFALVIILLVLDLFVFHKKNEAIGVKSALKWSAFWIGLAMLFNLGVWKVLGPVKGLEFFTAYLLEESLSIDNLFVFIMIFSFFKIEPKYQHGVLFWGIIGAIIFRAIFIFAGVALISKFAWIMYVFGAFLLYTGIKMIVKKDDDEFNPENNIIIKAFKKVFPVTTDMSQPKFFIRENGKKVATTFFIALLFIEMSDVLFAVDSVPAVLSVSKDVFIVYTSNIFAILGLRSLYFALSGIMPYFHYLKYALAGILSFIGVKMCVNELIHDGLLSDFFKIGNFTSLGVIVAFLLMSIIASLIWKKK